MSNCMHAPRHAGDLSRTTLTRTCRPLACHIVVGNYVHPKSPGSGYLWTQVVLSLSKSGGSPWTRPCSPPRLMNNMELGVGVVALPCHGPHSGRSWLHPIRQHFGKTNLDFEHVLLSRLFVLALGKGFFAVLPTSVRIWDRASRPNSMICLARLLGLASRTSPT